VQFTARLQDSVGFIQNANRVSDMLQNVTTIDNVKLCGTERGLMRIGLYKVEIRLELFLCALKLLRGRLDAPHVSLGMVCSNLRRDDAKPTADFEN
jgi:hypothetical protein